MLTVATGSIDGDATRLMSAVAAEMAAKESPVRLKVVDKGTALDAVNAFAGGETDLAIVRADVGDLSAARTVVVLTYAVVLIAVPPGSAIDSMDGLKGKTVGVIAGPVNRKLVAAIVKAYDLDRAKVTFLFPKFLLRAFEIVNVHADCVPTDERSLIIVDGRCCDLKPAVFAVESAEACGMLRGLESWWSKARIA